MDVEHRGVVKVEGALAVFCAVAEVEASAQIRASGTVNLYQAGPGSGCAGNGGSGGGHGGSGGSSSCSGKDGRQLKASFSDCAFINTLFRFL